MYFLPRQACSLSVALRKAWLGSQEANRQLSHARAWESLSLPFQEHPWRLSLMPLFFIIFLGTQ